MTTPRLAPSPPSPRSPRPHARADHGLLAGAVLGAAVGSQAALLGLGWSWVVGLSLAVVIASPRIWPGARGSWRARGLAVAGFGGFGMLVGGALDAHLGAGPAVVHAGHASLSALWSGAMLGMLAACWAGCGLLCERPAWTGRRAALGEIVSRVAMVGGMGVGSALALAIGTTRPASHLLAVVGMTVATVGVIALLAPSASERASESPWPADRPHTEP